MDDMIRERERERGGKNYANHDFDLDNAQLTYVFVLLL
jgi:hypothetical protein